MNPLCAFVPILTILLSGLADLSETASLAATTDGSGKVVCYVGTWANYRTGAGKFVIEDIDPFLCTHVIYAFAKLGPDNRIAPYDAYLDLKENWGLGAYERVNALKKKNPKLKTLIAIGGWNEGSTKYSNMASNPQTRKVFADSCVEFLQKYNFDGLDVDWEYPANRGGASADKQNFVLLLKDLREAFKANGYLLTAAVSAGKATIDTAYDIPGISQYLDFINLMTYDFDGAWSSKTGHNAPLYGNKQLGADQEFLNVEFAVKYWIQKGAPPSKLILGVPFYGRCFSLQNPTTNGVGAPSSGTGLAGPYTKEPGFLGYNEICEMMDGDGSWKKEFDEVQQVPYAYRDKQWVSYDNMKSTALKVQFAKKMKLGGAMVWSIETDDFKGNCKDGRYPLLNTIKKNLKGLEPDDTEQPITDEPSKTRPTPNARRETTTEKPVPSEATTDNKSPCKEPGYFVHPKTCKKFINCVQNYPSGFTVYEFDCPPGTLYSTKMKVCTFPYQASECKEKV